MPSIRSVCIRKINSPIQERNKSNTKSTNPTQQHINTVDTRNANKLISDDVFDQTAIRKRLHWKRADKNAIKHATAVVLWPRIATKAGILNVIALSRPFALIAPLASPPPARVMARLCRDVITTLL